MGNFLSLFRKDSRFHHIFHSVALISQFLVLNLEFLDLSIFHCLLDGLILLLNFLQLFLTLSQYFLQVLVPLKVVRLEDIATFPSHLMYMLSIQMWAILEENLFLFMILCLAHSGFQFGDLQLQKMDFLPQLNVFHVQTLLILHHGVRNESLAIGCRCPELRQLL